MWEVVGILVRGEADYVLTCCPLCYEVNVLPEGGPGGGVAEDATYVARALDGLCQTAQWPSARLGCPFCGTTDHTKLSYFPSDDGVYRLYVCQECRRYLKTIDMRQVHRVILLPLERVTSVAMDAAALEAGYG